MTQSRITFQCRRPVQDQFGLYLTIGKGVFAVIVELTVVDFLFAEAGNAVATVYEPILQDVDFTG